MFNVQWMPISFVWFYMFKCDVFVLNHMWIKVKRFLFFLFAFGRDLYHPYFSKFFKLFLFEKHVFWVFSWLISCISSITSQMVQISSFSILDREFHDYFASKVFPRVTSENFQISSLKGISWDIYFKLLLPSSKPLF